jgi:hypothetical protein
MGACGGKIEPGTPLQAAGETYTKNAKMKDKKLDEILKQEMQDDKLELKLLLLGKLKSFGYFIN